MEFTRQILMDDVFPTPWYDKDVDRICNMLDCDSTPTVCPIGQAVMYLPMIELSVKVKEPDGRKSIRDLPKIDRRFKYYNDTINENLLMLGKLETHLFLKLLTATYDEFIISNNPIVGVTRAYNEII
jgi:hypothetical protein